ncbi:MAG TPA: pitrilysin family protein, partial [Thermoanaerobaculia bacterium]|nr:pitrilysin family protein [Thermoanaerobaculia bacterium]
MRKSHLLTGVLVCLTLVSTLSAAPPIAEIQIPYQKKVLDNGLTVVVHEDPKAPIIALNVWYHVGSKNEPEGRSGFAHLFEHLMFNGSENFDDDYFQVLERVGATDLNGTTNEDRTNYFQNVPTSAVDLALWMESDRMGHLLGAITQEKLDEQRGVVQNEKRQGENQPYAVAWELITEATWPAEHPYSHTVIGSMEDLDAASLDDVKEWFKSYYGPSNAVIVIAGDVKAEEGFAIAQKYFGDIAPGPPIAHFDAWVAKRTGEQRQRVQDRVPQGRLYMVWNIPGWGTAEGSSLDLVTDVLGAGKTSRLYKRLVYDDQIATDVAVFLDEREIASQLMIMATARPGEDLANVEKAVREELAKLLQSGPTAAEVERVKTQYIAGFVRGIERIGGFGGKSDILAISEVYGGSPDAYRTRLSRVAAATPKELHDAARAWLSDGVYLLEVHPFGSFKAAESGADRSMLPDAGSAPEPEFPALARAELSNGMKLIVAERRGVPVVSLQLLLDAGYAADQFAVPGTANLAMGMLDEGTKKRNALQISEDLAMLGAQLSTGSNLDQSFVSLSALKANLDSALDIFADVVLNPSFPQADFDRLKKQQLASIQREKVQPIQMALRVFPRLLYGEDHAYGAPLTGSGTETSVAGIERDDLAKF